MIYQLNALIG